MSEEKIIIHNKLVRDKIPEMLFEKKIQCITRLLGKEEEYAALRSKLKEEVDEFFRAHTREEKVEELADILEVLFALSERLDCPLLDLEKIRQSKKEKRGGFSKGIFLEKTVDKK